MKYSMKTSRLLVLLYFVLAVSSNVRVSLVTGFTPSVQRVRRIHNRRRGAGSATTARTYCTVRLANTGSTVIDVEGKEETETNNDSNNNNKAELLKRELLSLADRTKRGFKASSTDRREANRIISELSQLSQVKEPASDYYYTTTKKSSNNDEEVPTLSPSIKGKWKLVYTDAPDITSLDQNPLAQLGRIGQECSPPFIKNVIEYTKPSWASNFPLSGTENSRVLQKVITKASASPDKPTKVKLEISGLEIIGTEDKQPEGDATTTSSATKPTSLSESIQRNGLVAGIFQNRPLELKGPLDALPFGEFEILYLDDELRIIRTGQSYVAVNIREDWF